MELKFDDNLRMSIQKDDSVLLLEVRNGGGGFTGMFSFYFITTLKNGIRYRTQGGLSKVYLLDSSEDDIIDKCKNDAEIAFERGIHKIEME